MSDVTVTTEAPAPNSPEARTSDGTLKDVTTPNTTPTSSDPKSTSSTEPEGTSFLTGKGDAKPDPAVDKTQDAPEKAEGEGQKDDKAAVGAPEKYADFKLPDGYKFDPAELTKAQALFKDLNLSQDQAQKAVDLYSENSLQAAKAPYDAWAKLQKDWGTEITNRFGDRTNQVRSDINKAIDTVLPPSLARNFRAGLDLTGAGTHPDIVEALSILFKPHFEGTPVRGAGPSKEGQRAPGSAEAVSLADAIYPHLRK